MSIKIGVLALSINADILRSHYLKSYENFLQANMTDMDVVVEGLVFTQGFDIPNIYTGLHLVRDDSMFRKGYSIAEIRDHFTWRAINEYKYDYLFICDDDSVFGPKSGEAILRDYQYMRDHPGVGMTNMKYKNLVKEDYDMSYPLMNPSKVYVRSGILMRVDAFVTWGAADKVIYFEECVLAGEAYRKGFEIVQSAGDITHKGSSSGLGKTLEDEYEGRYGDMPGGRQVMCKKGYYSPYFEKDGRPNYRKPCLVTPKLECEHRNNYTERMKYLET